jgi:hypothetical protein
MDGCEAHHNSVTPPGTSKLDTGADPDEKGPLARTPARRIAGLEQPFPDSMPEEQEIDTDGCRSRRASGQPRTWQPPQAVWSQRPTSAMG